MTGRRGRPRLDRLDLVERVAVVLANEPDASTRRIQAVVRANRADVVRAAKLLKSYGTLAEGANPVLKTADGVREGS